MSRHGSIAVALLALGACAPAFEHAPDRPVEMHATPHETPLERAGYERLTTHDELMAFVEAVAERSPRITRRSLGTSVEERDIPYLEISRGEFGADETKARVLVFAQQHGNEPSGKEAALMLLRDIAAGEHDELLERVDLLLVPTVNPDGAERHQRHNAEGVDLNRSHLVLNGQEVRHLRELFHEWTPEVTLDVHEYRPWVGSWTDHGYVRLFDEQYGLPTNLNVDEGIRRLARERFLPLVDERLHARGYTHHEYLVGSPDYIRYSTSDINDGRQGFAILGTLGLILEGKNGRTPTENIERRAHAQTAAIEELLRFVAAHSAEVLSVVGEARGRLTKNIGEPFVLIMDRARASGPLEMVAAAAVPGDDGELTAGDTIRTEIVAYHPTVVPMRTIDLPAAYLVPGAEEEILDLLREHRVRMQPLDPGQRIAVERLHLERFERVPVKNETFDIPVVTTRRETYVSGAGDVLVPTAQLRGRMVATALEPESMHHLMRYDGFEHLRGIGRYPVMRVLDDAR